MEIADVYWMLFAEGGSEEVGSDIFLIVESQFHSGERLVFIFNRGGHRSLQTDRLRKAPSVSVVSLEVATM